MMVPAWRGSVGAETKARDRYHRVIVEEPLPDYLPSPISVVDFETLGARPPHPQNLQVLNQDELMLLGFLAQPQ